MSNQNSHASPAGSSGPQVPEPSHAEKAKTLVHAGGISSLSTLSKKHDGYPFGSLMPYGISEVGEPIFLISSMAMHTRNLNQNPNSTLLILQRSKDGDSLGAGRVSLMGRAIKVVDEQRETVAEKYLERNPEAKNWMGFGDFSFYKLELIDIYFVGGFGVMGWVSADEYLAAKPDPLAPLAEGIISHMNQDHGDALVAIATQHSNLEVQSAAMTSVDRLGFNMKFQIADGYKGIRIPFPESVDDPDDIRSVFVKLTQQARKVD